MIDLPNGASGLIAGNTFVQGKDKENWSGFIVVAAEAHDFPADGLVVRDNDARLALGVERSPAFVADLSGDRITRSEEHTSELQSLMRISYAVFCLKKKNNNRNKKSDRTRQTTQQ